MSDNKKKGFPRIMFVAAVLAVYLKARDSLNVGGYACGLAVRQCGLGEFVFQIILWTIALFAIMYFIKFFLKMVLAPEKRHKKKLMLKQADHQAHKNEIKKKLKKKKAKKKEKDKVGSDDEPEVEVLEPDDDLSEQEEESDSDVESKEVADPWAAIDEHDKEDEEVIRI